MTDDNQATTTTSTVTNGDAFGNNNQATNDTGTHTQSTDQVFTHVVGEGKQYATQEDLAKGKIEADAFIEQLKVENAQMREDLGKRPTLDDVQDMMKLQNESQNNTSSELNEEALNTIVQTQLQVAKSQELAHANVTQASNKMEELYGEKANEQVKLKAGELGVSVQYLQDIAAKNPEIFYATMGVSNKSTVSNTSVAGNQTVQGNNTEQFNNIPTGSKEGTWGYYENLRKENPKVYFSPKVQNEMFQMRKQKDADFYK